MLLKGNWQTKHYNSYFCYGTCTLNVEFNGPTSLKMQNTTIEFYYKGFYNNGKTNKLNIEILDDNVIIVKPNTNFMNFSIRIISVENYKIKAEYNIQSPIDNGIIDLVPIEEFTEASNYIIC